MEREKPLFAFRSSHFPKRAVLVTFVTSRRRFPVTGLSPSSILGLAPQGARLGQLSDKSFVCTMLLITPLFVRSCA